jgi:phenylpyruvate tautomerase PptA (4-oxalocrotonate tautomerase family)
MPFVRIDLREGTSPAYRRAVADTVHQALVETAGTRHFDKRL